MNGLPKQRIPISQKNDEWKRNTINYFEQLSYTSVSNNRTSNFNKLINYDLFNGRFNKADLEYVCNPLGLMDNEFPATLQHYDIVSPAFNLLISEEGERPENFIVLSESPEDINRKDAALKEKITKLLQERLLAEIDPSTVDPNNPLPTPEQIAKYERHNTSDLVESQANKILKSLRRKLNTHEIFKKGWKDALIAGEEMYWIGISNNEPIARRVNPVNTTVVLDADSDFIDDAIAVVEVRMLAPATIIDEFGDKLTPKQVEELEAITRGTSNIYQQASGLNPTFVVDKDLSAIDTGTPSGFNSFGSTNGSFNSQLVRVVRVEWKSFKKMYHLMYTDEMGQPIEDIVDETFKLSVFREAFPDAKTEEFWITEAWEGLRIGQEIYVEANPKPNQRRRMDNPYHCKLGYVGLIYNATNSQSVSLMDRLKPFQYLYNIISYRLELAFASDQGRVFLMDLAQIPRSEGMDIDRWMYYLKAMKIAFINSFEEGRKGVATGKIANFNQFQSIDLSLANTIQQYIETLDYIRAQIAYISGVSPQRLGAIKSNELVGNVERSVEQSALITEYMFDSHTEVKRRFYTALIEAAKIAYRNGHVTQYILDDMGIEMLNLKEFELENSEFNVYLSDASKDHQVVSALKQLAQAALQSDKADLSTIIDTMINDNPRDIVRTLQRGEKAKYERDAKAQQAQMEAENNRMNLEAQRHAELMDLETKKLDLQQYIADSTNETKIQVAEINAMRAMEGPTDMDNDGIPDPVEVANLALEERSLASKNFIEQSKINADKEKHSKEISLKERELKMKEDIEKKKIEAIKVQNISQEKIAKQQAELKKKEMENKLKVEKLKLQAAKAKAAKQNKPKK